MNRKNRLFIWAFIKLIACLYVLIDIHEVWSYGADLVWHDWLRVVIAALVGLKSFLDIESTTEKSKM